MISLIPLSVEAQSRGGNYNPALIQVGCQIFETVGIQSWGPLCLLTREIIVEEEGGEEAMEVEVMNPGEVETAVVVERVAVEVVMVGEEVVAGEEVEEGVMEEVEVAEEVVEMVEEDVEEVSRTSN